MRKHRRTIVFHDDLFDEKYTFSEVSAALKAIQPGQSLCEACRANRMLEHPVQPKPVTQAVRCPVCKKYVPEVRRVSVCGRMVTLYPHPATSGRGVGRICRVEA